MYQCINIILFTVDLVIFAFLDVREFVILRLLRSLEFGNYQF